MYAWAYISYYRSRFKKYTWVCDYAEDLIQKDPQAGLELILEVLNISQNDTEIAYVATGLLEDLLHRHMDEEKSMIEAIIQRDDKLKAALRFVWASADSPVQHFLKDIHVKIGNSTEKDYFNRSDKSTAVDE